MPFSSFEQDYKYIWKKIYKKDFNIPPMASSSFKVAKEHAYWRAEENKKQSTKDNIEKQYYHDCKYYYKQYREFGGTKSENQLQEEAIKELEAEEIELIKFITMQGL